MKKVNDIKTNKLYEFIIFVTPALILVLMTSLIPFMMNIIYAFTSWNGVSRVVRFIGFKNFIELFTDDTGFMKATLFTFRFSFLYVILVNSFALILAILLDKGLKTQNFLRAAFFLPVILSLVIVGFMWRFIFTRGFGGLFNITGLSCFQACWLANPDLAFNAVVLVSIWQSVGFYMVIYIAGLQSIPSQVLEAAIIDGVDGFQKFTMIILPLIMPSVTVSLFFSMANALKTFDLIFTLTNGGPAGSTTTIALDIYREAFINNRYGYGISKSLVFFLIVLIITYTQLKYFKKREIQL